MNNKKYKVLTKRYQTLHFVLGAAFIGIIWLIVEMLMPMGKFGDTLIYKYQVNNYLSASSDNAVKNIAKTSLFYEAMSDLGIEVSESEVDAEMADIVKKYGGVEEFEKVLIDTLSDYNSYEESVRKGIYRLKAQDYLLEKENFTEDDYKKYYDEHPEIFIDTYENVYEDVIIAYKTNIKD